MANSKTARVTKSAVESLKENQILRDSEIRGFGARRRQGLPSYFLQTRVNGRLRWITIGKHGAPWSPVTARKEALRLLGAISAGDDPNERKKQARHAPTLKEAAELFLEEHGVKLKASTLKDYRGLFRHHIEPRLGQRQVRDIARKDVSALHAGLAHIPRQANYALSVLAKFMSWAEEQGLRSENSNPCTRIKRYREVKRQRYLSAEEMERLGRTLDEFELEQVHSPYVVAAVRLLILTGARLSEILTLQWQYVDLERGMLLLPDSKTGQKTIFLSNSAVQLLTKLPIVQDNPYVIVGQRRGRPIVNLQKPWQLIRNRAGLEDIRLHDLRHSFASIAAANGASLPLIGKLLGHTQVQTTQRYAHLVNDPVKELNEAIGEQVSNAMSKAKEGR